MVITRKTFAFLDFHLQPLAQVVKSCIKHTNDFLNNLRATPKLPDNIILCTVDVGLYPNISHEESLSVLRKRLDNRMEKYISSDTLCDLAEVVLNRNVICTSYSTLFMAELEEEILRKVEFKPYLWWRYWSKTSINFLDVTVSQKV